MKIFVIGSSITSSYWNGAATYYRGIYKGLAAKGHEITFAEPDAYDRQKHRDSADISFVESIVYQSPKHLSWLLSLASEFDLVIKHSGVGVDDERLESELVLLRSPRTRVAFWDVDAPATLNRIEADENDYFRRVIPDYDFIFTYGGGSPVVSRYAALGSRNCFPIYNALDPETHFPVPGSQEFACDLALIANRMPDREKRIEDFYVAAAEMAPEFRFLLGGAGWSGKRLPPNVHWIGHVRSDQHNAVNCSARMVLNLNRDSMASVGFSPPTRVFEAAGAGACLITDSWPGIDQFFAPEREILVADSAEVIVELLNKISKEEATQIGAAMKDRALRDHTYALRAAEVSEIFSNAYAEKAA